ncbi:sugar ABC transporter permease [Chloroflexi bacterium TSY]|nr:sugar ABC transporter permease [Chloroflexi bacterium TSY]
MVKREDTIPMAKLAIRLRSVIGDKSQLAPVVERLIPYAFILPALIFYTIFLAIPIVGTVFISLLDWSGLSLNDIKWAGIRNYIALTEDDVFGLSLKHNLIFIVVGSSGIVVRGLFLAVLLERGLPGSNFFRGVFFVPTVMSMVVVSVVFMLILSPELGLVNPLLRQIGLGSLERAWLGDPGTALYTVITVDVWKNFGFAMFLFVAGLKSIDAELYEASRIDGAAPWQSFWRITMPILWPVTTLVIILVSINTLKLFDLIFVMTAGGPNHASQVLTSWMYLQGFTYNNMGYGSAIAVVLLVLTFILTLIQFKVLRRDQEE